MRAVAPGRRADLAQVAAAPLDVLLLSASYGGGHEQAAGAVSEALEEIWPGCLARQLDYLQLLNPTFHRLTSRLYLTSIKHLPAGWGAFYHATSGLAPHSAWQRWVNRLGLEKLRALLAATRPRVVVCTYPVQAGVLSDMRRRNEPVPPQVTVITDRTVHNQWIHPHVDAYCVSDDEVAAGLVRSGIPAGRVHVTGLPVRAAFRAPLPPRRAGSPHVLLMGGYGMPGGVPEACRALLGLPAAPLVSVVCGRDLALQQQLGRLARAHPARLRVLGFVHDVAGLMAEADLLVGKAGAITTAEALTRALPLVVYRPIPGQEAANAAYLCRHGAAVSVRGPRELMQAVGRLLDRPEERAACAAAARALARPRAALDAARIVRQLCG